MKKTILYIAAALMAMSLEACTPNTEKQAETAADQTYIADRGDTILEPKVP